jgi:alkylmercury lyase-like protein
MCQVDERDLRRWVYSRTIRTGSVPSIAEISRERGGTHAAIRESLRRLGDIHAFALVPESGEIWMAHPFSAVPTAYRVRTPNAGYWANCAWDAIAIPTLLGTDATVEARCPDCTDTIALEFHGGELTSGECVVHFAVPPRRFWENVGFT